MPKEIPKRKGGPSDFMKDSLITETPLSADGRRHERARNTDSIHLLLSHTAVYPDSKRHRPRSPGPEHQAEDREQAL